MFLRIRGSPPSWLLLPEMPRSFFKKRSGNLTKGVSYKDIFSKARAMRKTSVFLLLKTDLPAELKQRNTLQPDTFCSTRLRFPNFGGADELAELFITNSLKTLKSQEDWELKGCHNFLLRGFPEILNSVLVILVKLPTNLWSWSVLFVFPPLRYTAL